MSETIQLKTKSLRKVSVDSRFAQLSGLVSSVLEDSGLSEEIPIEYVSDEILTLILSYAEHHDYIAPAPITRPVTSNNIEELVEDSWDAEYILSVSQNEEDFYEFIMTVNYLDIKSILDLCLGYIATQFKGKDVEEIRREYRIEQEFTLEVEEQLKEEYPWALEESEDVFAKQASE